MSFSAGLLIDSIESPFIVRRFSWSMQQNTDVVGRPDARVQGGHLQVELDSQPNETLQHWSLDDTKKMNGSLVVAADDDGSAVQTEIKFEEAFCVGFNKSFDGSASKQGMIMSLSLSANKISIATVNLDNAWPA